MTDDDDALQERDERVRITLLEVLAYNREMARQLRQDAQNLERDTRHIEEAVHSGAWWRLKHYLDDADVESLCAVSPAALLTEAP